MTLQRTVIVVGNSVAAMIASLTLAEGGWRVMLVTPSRRFGGHFGGIPVGDVIFDAGMVLLEFTSFNAAQEADLRTYDPRRRNDVGRFFLLPIVQIPRPDTSDHRPPGQQMRFQLLDRQRAKLNLIPLSSQLFHVENRCTKVVRS